LKPLLLLRLDAWAAKQKRIFTRDMKKHILILTTAAMTFAAAPAFGQGGATERSPREQEREKEKNRYTCPMHPEVVTDHPGKCPKCGMELVPLKTKSKHRTHLTSSGQANIEHPTSKSEHASGEMHAEHAVHGSTEHEMSIQSTVNLAEPMSRESSGTAWVPDSTPMYGQMFMFGDDMLMLHGGIFPRYTNVSTRRGDDRIDAPNWIMAMYSHPLEDYAQLGGRLMMSLDPLTEGGRGYPLLFQSGESWHDQPLHDRQHPHDLFDELSIAYSQKFDHDLSAFLYFGYPGEPALGPPTFMHRLSAMDNPDAPIGHHWQDSTHITFGVATAGLAWRNIKIEGSSFTGREPDEDRYDFDRPRFDSFSGRISWNPTANIALQFSHGYIKSPEALEPDLKTHRTTASIIYNLALGQDHNWSNSFVWGQNNATGEGKTQSFLLESNYQRGRNTIYTRWENVEKSGHELVLKHRDEHLVSTVNAISIGYVRDLRHGKGLDIGLGGQFTVNVWPDQLNRYYGDGVGYGFQVFLRIRPSLHGDHVMPATEMDGAAPSMSK
jgi:heavy metal-binding protein